MLTHKRLWLILMTMVVLFLLPSIALAQGETILTVTTTADNGDNDNPTDGSLRWALRQAQLLGGNVRIEFAPGLDGQTIEIQDTKLLPIVNENVTIDGDIDNDDDPDVTMDGSDLMDDCSPFSAGSCHLWSGITIYGDNNTIEGLIIHSFPGSGIVLAEDEGKVAENNTIRYNYIGVNASADAVVGIGDGYLDSEGLGSNDGIFIIEGASNNLVEHNIIGGAKRAGVWISGVEERSCNSNTVRNNYIGTNASGADLGNGTHGIIIQNGAQGNIVQDNTVRYNGMYGVKMGNERQFLPNRTGRGTQENQIISNTIADNKATGDTAAGILNTWTHDYQNPIPSTGEYGDGDNLIQSNNISNNNGAGIYNIGASPRIIDNTIEDNTSYGIINVVDYGPDRDSYTFTRWFGTFSQSLTIDLRCYNDETLVFTDTTCYDPLAASPTTVLTTTERLYSFDIPSVPYIANNIIDGNGDTGIYSMDTAPAEITANTIGENGGLDIRQVWRGAVEVFDVHTSQAVTEDVHVYVYSTGGDLLKDGNDYDSASGGLGIWAEDPTEPITMELDYDNVTTWLPIDEYIVNLSGEKIEHSAHEVVADVELRMTAGMTVVYSVYTTTRVVFSFDGDKDTDPLDGGIQLLADNGLPFYRTDYDGLDRYQIAEVTVDSNLDSDNDGIPDIIEGGDDLDGDGTPNYDDTDADGDGIPDVVEGGDDADGDGIPNFLDNDSDGDGIPDVVEGGDDADGDGTPNFLDDDSDGDGISDLVEGGDDMDGDGTPNFLDDDSDGDGVLDTDEHYDGECPAEFTDAEIEDCDDVDGDGIPNFIDSDSDGDGIPDEDEYYAGEGDEAFCTNTEFDQDGDDIPNCQDNDADNDGIPNYLDTDTDNDGIPDSDTEPSDSPEDNTHDPDNDNIWNYLDPTNQGMKIYLPIIMRNYGQ